MRQLKVRESEEVNLLDDIRSGDHATAVSDFIRAEAGDAAVTDNLAAARRVLTYLPAPGRGTASPTGLILGRIQAGKTMGIISTIALAADNGYRMFIVLTSDNVWLRNQTYARLSSALPGLYFPDGDEFEQLALAQVSDPGVVFVCTKNATRLRRLTESLNTGEFAGIPAVIIDDEADQASLNTNAANPAADLSAINALIGEIRGRFDLCPFLQVTATPGALLLQPTGHDFRPEFIVVLEPGMPYVGGQLLFDPDRPHIRPVDLQELLDFLNGRAATPFGLRRAVFAFLIAATLKHMGRHGRAFFFLCHVSHLKQHHDLMRQSIEALLHEAAAALAEPDGHPTFLGELRAAYDDIAATAEETQAFELVLQRLRLNIPSRDIQVLNTDSESVEPRDNRIYNFLIGGNRLGRGVTIKRLLVTYYGRSQANQMDTMQQHARMYGYRAGDLDVIRIYTPRDMAARFRFLDESDTALRELVRTGQYQEIEPIFADRSMRITRANVLAGDVGYYVAGRVYSPQFPKYLPVDVQGPTAKLDRLLNPYNRDNVTHCPAERVDIDFLIQLLGNTHSYSDQGGLWDDERVAAALQTIRDRFENTGYLVVRRGRELSKPDGRLRDPGTPQDRPLRVAARPTLWMYRQNGTGWAGTPFWVPRLQFPDGRYAVGFNLSEV